MSTIRQGIGICLQHDCLFPILTVREHIQFFARLKGLYRNVSLAEAEMQVDQALIDVALSEKRNALSKNLSGGMKRKLSVAIAFCGGSDVVMLDEPTSGMDPFSRRFTWNIIRQYKKDRIIILTTHLMDEADILGDRIAILADGRLRCVGSSLFLKQTYGVGYQLTIERIRHYPSQSVNLPNCIASIKTGSHRVNPQGIESYTEEGAKQKLIRVVTNYVPDAVLLGTIGSELRFSLPLASASLFVPIFLDLEEKIQQGVIRCYGVSVTNLSEVFLRVSKGTRPSIQEAVVGTRSSFVPFEKDTLLSYDLECNRLFSRQVVALMKKRGLSFCRDKKAWICTSVVPSIFVFVGFLMFALTSSTLSMSPLILKTSDYNADLGMNQITFNSPEFSFVCQPGICSHLQPYYTDSLSNEGYAFCGYEAKFGISIDGFRPSNQSCTVAESNEIFSVEESSNLLLNDIVVENISEVRSRVCSSLAYETISQLFEQLLP